MKYNEKTTEIEATQWFKNGDHPLDNVGGPVVDIGAMATTHPECFGPEYIGGIPKDAPTYARIEGAVVRFFRHPDYRANDSCVECRKIWHVHGWLDSKRPQVVCPGDFVITDKYGDYTVMSAKSFMAKYYLTEP